MIFSFKELKRLANLSDNTKVEDVVNAINSIGFEVEEVKPFADVHGVKFGKILKVEKNPNADKLNVCEIEFKDKKRTIQTNADNVHENMMVIAFVPGSKVGDITFDAKELKGVVSEGMLSSLNEFGIDADLLREGASNGIQAYPEATINDDPIEMLGLQDSLIEVDILTNRSDANSYLVMAKELSSYFNTKPLELKVKEGKLSTDIKVEAGKHIHLSFIEAKNDFELSWYERVLIMKSGVKSIDDIVDLTNLTFLMSGQPVHAYDKEKVGKVFSSTHSSNTIKILGDKEVKLENNLTIISDKKDVSVAGAIGMENTGISSETKEMIFEFGIFDGKDIRSSVKAIKMNTNASSQSSKAISLGMLQSALDFITTKLNGFSKVVNPPKVELKTIGYSEEKINQVAGFEIIKEAKYKEVIDALTKLGFVFKADKVTIPSYRHDIETQQDMNEEVLRFYGYNNLKPIKPTMQAYKVIKSNDIRKVAASVGFYETVTYSLVSKEENIFNPFKFDKEVVLETFVSKKREIIRHSQIHSIMEAFEYNKKRSVPNIDIFSVGMIGNGKQSIILAKEFETINQESFNAFKNQIITLLPNDSKFEKANIENLHPGVSANIISNGKLIGVIGKVHPKISKHNVLFVEMLIEESETDKNFKMKEYSQDPFKYRDVTFDLLEGENIENKINNIEAHDKKIIDRFFKEGVWKITVRFIGTDEQIANIK